MHYEMNAAQSFGVCEIIQKNQFYVGKTFRFITISWRNSCLNLQWYRFLWAFRELNVSSLSPWKIQYYKKMRKFFGQDVLLSWMMSLHSFVICVSWTWEYIGNYCHVFFKNSVCLPSLVLCQQWICVMWAKIRALWKGIFSQIERRRWGWSQWIHDIQDKDLSSISKK